MDDQASAIVRIMAGLLDGSGPGSAPAGLLVVDPRGRATPALHALTGETGWPVVVHDLDRTNLNDLDHLHSPLADGLLHAGNSRTRHLVVLRGYVEEMADDDRLWKALAFVNLAGRSRLILTSAAACTAPRGAGPVDADWRPPFRVVDLS